VTKAAKIRIENVIQPGKTYPVDAVKFNSMREILLKVITRTMPGMTTAELHHAIDTEIAKSGFAGEASKSGWWMKAVQLDLEAKKIIARSKGSPLRLYKV
jgi:hypothetical protein